MKNQISLFCLIITLSVNLSIFSQDSFTSFNDYTKLQLTNTDTIPGFSDKENKLKISGTIFLHDGVTPAKDVILYIEQADEHGDFDLRTDNDNRYVHNRGWIKTDANGRYTFFTYVPGGDRRYKLLQQLFPIIKEPSKKEYELSTFLFDDDPLLTKLCRKRITKKGDPSRILKLTKQDDLLVVEKDIVLSNNSQEAR
ncbi:hypothetical protein RM697_09310 [Ichthyenterobacterium sp. W332]|uniref:Protocatechuate 3,4-dioxygenase beta subunit n=1 Tax=Microcosmobacter mediterraneus TaxID=3075607 RepID=A0ABU2YL04_9FLAO|nr:hypothetical protein [Ichthyenterobacterium sp. W332]MDT0558846.1 hypothetical protein [Ichthyenterobacterium sp. W332]